MDPRSLVNRERAEAARTFLVRLRADGFDVQAAMWAIDEGENQPSLYIVSENVERDGPLGAYRKLHETLRAVHPQPGDIFSDLDYDEVKLLGPRRPLAAALLRYLERTTSDRLMLYNGPAQIPVEAALIYPASLFAPPVAPPQPASA